MNAKLAVIYYSATGTTFTLAETIAGAARDAGAEVRLRRVGELAPDAAIDSNKDWRAHLEATRSVPLATLDDLEWADALALGSPTRYGNMASQLKQFIDGTGPLWARNALADKAVSCFTSAANPHGGQETTLLAMYNTVYHWGSVIVPPGYTHPTFTEAGGNPYGVSATGGADQAKTLEAARQMTHRLLWVARSLAVARDEAQAGRVLEQTS